MARKVRPALVRGRAAAHWEYADDCLIWRSPDRLIEIKVPVGDLADEGRMRAHFARVDAVAPAVVSDELDDILAGAKA